MENIMPVVGVAIVVLLIANAAWSDRRRYNRLIKGRDLPEGLRWYSGLGDPYIMVNVSDDNTKPKWELLVDVMKYRNGGGRYTTLEDMAAAMHQGAIETKGFTVAPEFPVPGGKWEVSHQIGDRTAVVNGHTVPAGYINDYRDTIVSMVMAKPYLSQRSQHEHSAQQLEQQDKLGEVLVNTTN
jgi:hypothetical protein